MFCLFRENRERDRRKIHWPVTKKKSLWKPKLTAFKCDYQAHSLQRNTKHVYVRGGKTEIKIPNTYPDIHVQRKPPKVNVIGIMVIVCNIKTCLKPITAFVCEHRAKGMSGTLSGYLKPEHCIFHSMCGRSLSARMSRRTFNYFVI